MRTERLSIIHSRGAPDPVTRRRRGLAPEGACVPLPHYLWIIGQNAWKISVFVLLSLVTTFIVSSRLQPVWEQAATQSSHTNAAGAKEQLIRLKANMSRSSAAVADFEQNVITPEEKTNLLASRSQHLSADYTAALEDRIKKGAVVEATKSGSLATEKISAPAAQLIESEYLQSTKREQSLRAAMAESKAEFDQTNQGLLEDYQRLKQKADDDKRLYEEFVKTVGEAGIHGSPQGYSVPLLDAGVTSLRAFLPGAQINLLLAAILSTLFGISAVLLFDSLESTIRDPDSIQRLYRTELIGMLPLVNGDKPPEAGELSKQTSSTRFDEAVRMVRNSILLSDFDRRLRSILVTSSGDGEGKTTSALHLAAAHAEQGKKTLLIDADLRRPNLHNRLRLPQAPGLAHVLTTKCSLREAVVQLSSLPNLHLLPSGDSSNETVGLTASDLAGLLDQAEPSYDLVVIDAPTLLAFPEPICIANAADGVVLVAVAGETNRKSLAAALSALHRVNANVLGMVFNRSRDE